MMKAQGHIAARANARKEMKMTTPALIVNAGFLFGLGVSSLILLAI
ncbi:hypothetical protein [Brevirhabdus pacifica]|nr:hypothetical protein [Brevirhabdus pacifica]